MGAIFGTPLQVIPWWLLEWVMEHPELGWVLVFIFLVIEMRTKYGRIFTLDEKLTGAIIVVRALAQQEEAIDEDKVDAYLAENGMSPADFFKPDDAGNNQSSFSGDD